MCLLLQDGGYHVPFAHPGLAAAVDMNSYRSELFENLSIQTVQPSRQASGRLSGRSPKPLTDRG